MKKPVKIILSIFLIIIIGGGVFFFGFSWGRKYFYQYDLPLGESPSLELPFDDSSHLDIIQGFGQLSEEYYHNGIDWGFNDSVIILSPYSGVIIGMRTWYNDKGGHWQTNLRIALNIEWDIEINFESWALNQTAANQQANLINVGLFQQISQGDEFGELLYFGSGCHIHMTLYRNYAADCPYTYLSEGAKTMFDSQFELYGINANPCM
jgi:hypothetical protein